MTSSSRSASPPTSSSPGDAPVTDIRGEVCPFTFVRTKLALEAVPIGATIRVVTDHEPAARNIPRSATEWGQEVLGVIQLPDGTWAIDLRRRVR
jgi:tRNA 2-thiouridine synthesizing protein A